MLRLHFVPLSMQGQRKHQILRAPIDGLHGAAPQHPHEFLRRRPGHSALPINGDVFDRASDDRFTQAADERFNFR